MLEKQFGSRTVFFCLLNSNQYQCFTLDNQRSISSNDIPFRCDKSLICSSVILPKTKYFACGCAKYHPETAAVGYIAKLSVNFTPLNSVAFNILNRSEEHTSELQSHH